MRTALYTRVSTDRQETENQLIALRAYCAAAGHEIVIEYVDDAVSGKTARRPAFQRMLDGARKRHFDLLLFWSLDRLSREGALQTLQHLQRLTDYRVAWLSHTEEYLNSLGPFADVVIALLGTIAKQERIKISERTKAGLARTKAKGTLLGRRRDVDAYAAVLAAHRSEPTASARTLAKLAGTSRATVARALAECFSSQIRSEETRFG